MNKNEALKLALVALNRGESQLRWEAITAIKEALSQPGQEPVAWICEGSSSDEKHGIDYWPGDVDDLPIGTPLYTSPPAQRTWVGLTDEDVEIINGNTWDVRETARMASAKSKEKNT